MSREDVVEFYMNLQEDYKVYRFVPHVAVSIYDELFDKHWPHSTNPRAVIAACFMLAQKFVDTRIISLGDLADAAVCTTEEIIEAEYATAVAMLGATIELKPELLFMSCLDGKGSVDRDRAFGLFDASLRVSCSWQERIRACLHVMEDGTDAVTKTIDQHTSPTFTACVSHLHAVVATEIDHALAPSFGTCDLFATV